MVRVVPYTALAPSKLMVDAVYESSVDEQLAGKPISRLL
jgi:hypothetical protein